MRNKRVLDVARVLFTECLQKSSQREKRTRQMFEQNDMLDLLVRSIRLEKEIRNGFFFSTNSARNLTGLHRRQICSVLF